jgi:predicted permease
MEGLIQDVRQAVRALRRRPGFTLTAVLTLAIGIGANAAVFTIVDALLLRPLPFGDRSARVVSLHSTHPTQPEDWPDARLSGPDLDDLRRSTRLLEDVAGYLGRNFTVAETAGLAERVRGGGVTPNLFPLLGVQPALGRFFVAEEAQPIGLEPAVILSYGLWQSRFGGDPAIVGKPILVNQRARTVVGVMPAGFRFPERDDIWLPLAALPGSPRDQRMLAGIGVLRPGVRLAQLQAELDGLAAALAARHPSTNREWGLRALMYRDLAFDRAGRVAVFSLMGAVALVLLIGCANLSNLLLAAGVARQREIAVRTAIGASRARIVREMLAEGLVLSAAGGLLGAVLGRLGLDALVASWPEELPYWIHFDVDARVVGFLAVIVVLTAIAFGLLPALRASRPDVIEQLKEGARSAGSRADRRLQGGLVVAQVALCLALLVGANLMIRTFLKLQAADPGFDEKPLASLRLYLPGDAYNPLPAKAAFVRRAVDRLRALPGVAAAAATTSIPADDGGLPIRIVADGRPVEAGRENGAIMIATVPSLFDTLGVRLVAGRPFTDGETEQAGAPVAIVNGRLARHFWPDGSALGRRLGLVDAQATTWLTIVGIAPEMQYEEFGEETAQSALQVYVPYGRMGVRTIAFLVRGTAPAASLLRPMRAALAQVEAQAPVYDVSTMRERRALTTWERRFFGEAVGAFALVALLLACLGVYGVLSYTVSRRTREIGVRIAVGAAPIDVMRLVVGQAAALAGIGAAVGLLLSTAVAYLLQGILYGVVPHDPKTLLGTATLLVAVVIGASALPARRATRIDPVDALRQD